LKIAFVNPKTTIKEVITEGDVNPKAVSASLGKIDLSMPTIPPTKAFTITSRVNCFQF
jgi:hypothetical protein